MIAKYVSETNPMGQTTPRAYTKPAPKKENVKIRGENMGFLIIGGIAENEKNTKCAENHVPQTPTDGFLIFLKARPADRFEIFKGVFYMGELIEGQIR